ncbi:3-ketoacyl-ACP reductase [bacterium]|nr:3-ketoacyl-ACP reductase [bacterium]
MNTQDKRIALVTGSGRGIGRGIALQLARDGYHVIVNGVNVDPANTASGVYEVKSAIEAKGGTADVIRADVSSAQDRQSLVAIIENLGRLDLLVNNAGVAPTQRRDLLEADEESFDRLISINLKGPYFLTRDLARRMIDWKSDGIVEQPRIAFITSISAYASSPSRGEYCLSKAGLSMAATLFADRLAEVEIPVIEIRPGIIRTDMTGAVQDKYDRLIAEGLLPTRRWGLPEDVAKAVSAFARGDLDYSTGTVIDVDGGFRMRKL